MELSKQFLGKAAELLPLMAEDTITDILINGTQTLFVERLGNLEPEPSPFLEKNSLYDFIERLVVPIGKRIDAAHPYLDGRLADGSRFHIILPPIAHGGPLISIRKHRQFDSQCFSSFASSEILQWLSEQVRARKNILIGGSTGSGKTTLLSQLLNQVPSAERIALIEESLEIRTLHPHALQMEARPPSPDGKGEVTVRSLIRNALRMRPDRIVVGECRGEEAFDMLQAMNTGHLGSLCTIHANSALDSLKRLETLVLLSGLPLPFRAVREWISACIHVVVHLERTESGRQIAELLTVQGLEGEVYRITPILRPRPRSGC